MAECNYGGRITDIHDRRLLASLLEKQVNLKVASERGYNLAETKELYLVPAELQRQNIIEVTNRMNVVPHPQGMGLSENSAMVRDLRDSKRLLRGVLLTQPGIAEEVCVHTYFISSHTLSPILQFLNAAAAVDPFVVHSV